MVQQWEYLITNLRDSLLDDLGEDGWEMCGVSSTTIDPIPTLYFKRPKMPEKRTATLNVRPVTMVSITDEQKDKLVKDIHKKPEDNENKDTDYWK